MDYEACRDKYRPERIRLLIVGESRPANGTFFYCANSNLYRETRRAFEEACGKVWESDEAFLEAFKNCGYYLLDLHDHPVSRATTAERCRWACERVDWLADRLRELQPCRIVSTPKLIQRAVEKAVQQAELTAIPLDFLPFPVMHWRKQYQQRLVEILKQFASNCCEGPCADPVASS